MRIKKINVESFGKIKGKHIELDDGINVIKGTNESGKSTLSRFVRFMLYGFTSRNADISKNDKKRYLPWDGSACKGEMVISTDNGSFTLRREQAARASHSITDENGIPVFQGECAGNAFLGVDEDTYDKTALVSAGDIYFEDAVSISGAIKNMVFSADSEVDSDSAVKKLDALRRSILGVSEKSGRLYEARLELAELSQRKEVLAAAHKELLYAEGMLDKIKQNIQRNKTAISNLEKERHNLDALDACHKLEKAEELKAKLDQSDEIYVKKSTDMTVNGFIPDRAYLSEMNDGIISLGEAENNLSKATGEHMAAQTFLKESFSNTKQLTFNNTLTDMGKTKESLKDDISLLKNEMKSKRRTAIILTALIITIPIAIFFFAGCNKIKKQLEALYKSFGCESLEELETLIDNFDASCELTRVANARVKEAKEALDEAYAMRGNICAHLGAMLEKCGRTADCSDPSCLAALAREHIKSVSASVEDLEAAYNALNVDKAAYDNYISLLGDLNALAQLADSFDQSIPLRESAKNAKELDFYTRATEGLLVQEREYEKKAAVIASNMDKPDELAAKISMLEGEIAELEIKHAAALMAKEAIESAHEAIRDNASPILTRKASELFSYMTDGKYKGLYVDNELKLSFLEEGSAEYRSVDYLSSGAADAAYLALRITLAQYLYMEKPVLIFDDAFSRLDDKRHCNVCRMLEKLAKEFQVIILTCHDREGELLGKEISL